MTGMSYVTLTPGDAEYPRLLKEIFTPPEKLWVRGTLAGYEPAIAIVGTRKPSTDGIEAAEYFSRALASYGLTIVSGLAFGIDKATHAACLDAGGRTIAVLASGVDVITPTSHRELGERIVAEGGAIVSEFPPGLNARAEQFPQRNRLVSGLALGVIVIEAPEESGALITARFALEQNREVFVVPGPVQSPNYVGSHRLIQEGAALLAEPEEVLDILGIQPAQPELLAKKEKRSPADERAQKIVTALRERDGRTPEELARTLGTTIRELNTSLTFLELSRYIRKENEKIYLNG